MVELLIEGVKCDVSDDISADLTYSLADIRTPDKRQVNYSKTITLAGTELNNYIFGNIFDIDVENPEADAALPNLGVNFSPKKLAKAQMLSDGIQIFDGTLRLWKVSFKGGFIYYEISLFGKLFDLFSEMGDKKLTDIDFSEFNHAYTWDNIFATFRDAWDGAFIYPLVDYGNITTDESGRPSALAFGSLIACLRYKVLIDKIFETNNASYVLNFADRTIFDKIIVTPNYGELDSKPSYFRADLTTDSRLYLPPVLHEETDEFGQQQSYYEYLEEKVECFNHITANSILFGAPVLSPYTTFNQNVSTSWQYTFDIEITNFGTDFSPFNTLNFWVRYTPNGQFRQDKSFVHLSLSRETTVYSVTLELPKMDFNINDTIMPMVKVCEGVTMKIKSGATVKAISPNDTSVYPLTDGFIYDINKSVPTDWTQTSFIKDFIKLFNLFVTQNPDDPKTYIFTPATNFYSFDKTKVIDWTKKIDYSEEIEFTPLSQLTAKAYVLTWKQDKDFWSEDYFNFNKEVYGQIAYLTDTDILSNIETIEFLASPAVMQRFNNSDVLCAGIYKVDNNNGQNVKKIDKFNNRLLIWGMPQIANHTIKYLKIDGTPYQITSSYPFAGHINHPVLPSFDLNFGNTNSDLPTATKNQFSTYWGKPLKEANHKDGKLISATALIKPEDVENLDFAGLYRVDNQFYRINKISGFNPFELSTSKVELIKVLNLPIIPYVAVCPIARNLVVTINNNTGLLSYSYSAPVGEASQLDLYLIRLYKDGSLIQNGGTALMSSSFDAFPYGAGVWTVEVVTKCKDGSLSTPLSKNVTYTP